MNENKDKVHSRREWYQIGYKDATRNMQEELAKINKLDAENIKLEQQSTARDIIHYVRCSFILNRRGFLKDLEKLAKEYGVEVE